jgi:hypothetical protein
MVFKALLCPFIDFHANIVFIVIGSTNVHMTTIVLKWHFSHVQIHPSSPSHLLFHLHCVSNWRACANPRRFCPPLTIPPESKVIFSYLYGKSETFKYSGKMSWKMHKIFLCRLWTLLDRISCSFIILKRPLCLHWNENSITEPSWLMMPENIFIDRWQNNYEEVLQSPWKLVIIANKLITADFAYHT